MTTYFWLGGIGSEDAREFSLSRIYGALICFGGYGASIPVWKKDLLKFVKYAEKCGD